MSTIIELRVAEAVTLDHRRLQALYSQLGESGADSVVCRAMEEVAVRLSLCQALWTEGQTAQLRKQARALIAIAEQIGMHDLARVAGHVTRCVDADDPIATAATLRRLHRMGEQSLSEIWLLQEHSL